MSHSEKLLVQIRELESFIHNGLKPQLQKVLNSRDLIEQKISK